ncbi:MAG: hypothetical protein KAJ03_11235 [Gammaproteobacteria bacterium]|nr:hypothetical protein [Gammaproteobacteria bacterium]
MSTACGSRTTCSFCEILTGMKNHIRALERLSEGDNAILERVVGMMCDLETELQRHTNIAELPKEDFWVVRFGDHSAQNIQKRYYADLRYRAQQDIQRVEHVVRETQSDARYWDWVV